MGSVGGTQFTEDIQYTEEIFNSPYSVLISKIFTKQAVKLMKYYRAKRNRNLFLNYVRFYKIAFILFQKQGYLIVENYFTEEELEPCKKAAEDLVEDVANKLFNAGKIKRKIVFNISTMTFYDSRSLLFDL